MGALQRVLVDVNGLMMPFQFKVNIDLELEKLVGRCEIVVPRQVLGELRNLSKAHPEARMALALVKKYRVVDVDSMTPDEGIVELARREQAFVLTNDRGLIARLKKERIKVIRLRSRSHLVLEGDFA